MIPAIVVDQAEKSGVKYLWDGKALKGINPPESMFGYIYFAHAIPPFKPDHTLMLGYGSGVVSSLMRKIWGAVKVTGIDLSPQADYALTEHKIKAMDAKDYLWDITTAKFMGDWFKPKFDYVCIDLWNESKVPDFVFETEFVVRLREVATKLISINMLTADAPKLKPYCDYGFKFDRGVNIEANSVIWMSVVEK